MLVNRMAIIFCIQDSMQQAKNIIHNYGYYCSEQHSEKKI